MNHFHEARPDDKAPGIPSRRSVTRAAVWAAPGISVAAAAPAFAATCDASAAQTAIASCLSTTANYKTNGVPGVFLPGSGYIWQPALYGNNLQANGTWTFTQSCAGTPYANWKVEPVSSTLTWRYTSSSGYPTGTSSTNPTKTYTTTNFSPSTMSTLGTLSTFSSTSNFAGFSPGTNLLINHTLGPATSYPVSQTLTLKITDPANSACSVMVTVTDSTMPLCGGGLPNVGSASAISLGWLVWWVC